MSEHSHPPNHACEYLAGKDGAVDTDPASQSLAEALRVSFRLLTIIMIVMAGAFLLTGLKTIESNEVGIIKVFGRYVGTAGEGLAYTWPYPVGQIEIVATNEQGLEIDNFWMFETADDKAKRRYLMERRAGGSLRPGWDGALLTGDRNLLHMKLQCQYIVVDPVKFARSIRPEYAATDPGTDLPVTIDPKEQLVRSAVCQAAVHTAATLTADGIQRGALGRFAAEVTGKANGALAAMETGLMIRRIEPKSTWPLKALPAYLAAQSASSNADAFKNAARSNAEGVLRGAAGGTYVKLVGDLWGTRDASARAAKGSSSKDHDLIGQYARLRERADAAGDKAESDELLKQAEDVLAKIDRILVSEATGTAQQIIREAEAYRTNTVQRVQARVFAFERLLPEYNRAPKFTIERLWAAAREEILESPGTEKYYLTTGRQKTILRISRDPEITRQILREKLAETRETKPTGRELPPMGSDGRPGPPR